MKKHGLLITYELQNIIDQQKKKKTISMFDRRLHARLISTFYSGVDVLFDYDRKRIYMNLDLGDEKSRNENLMPVNLKYENLYSFLKSCILEDESSIKVYRSIINQYQKMVSWEQTTSQYSLGSHKRILQIVSS